MRRERVRERASGDGNEMKGVVAPREAPNVLQLAIHSEFRFVIGADRNEMATMSTIPTERCLEGEGAPSAKICAITLTSHEITAIPFNPLSPPSHSVYLSHRHIRRQTTLVTFAHILTDR